MDGHHLVSKYRTPPTGRLAAAIGSDQGTVQPHMPLAIKGTTIDLNGAIAGYDIHIVRDGNVVIGITGAAFGSSDLAQFRSFVTTALVRLG